jgi:hypothetical protein
MGDSAQHELRGPQRSAVFYQSIWCGIGLYVIVFIFSLIAFFNGIDGELVGDSRELFSGNELMQNPWNLWDIWTTNYLGDMLCSVSTAAEPGEVAKYTIGPKCKQPLTARERVLAWECIT